MEILNQFKRDFDEYLKDYLDELPEKPEQLYGAVRYAMEAPAKRLRPMAVLLGYYLFKDDYEQALPMALSVEIFHNFTLVHDDIMDDAHLRRGQPSIHKKYGTNTAILVGDVMMIHAFRILLALDEEVNLDLIMDYYTEMGGGVCEGQIYDMAFESMEEITSDDYMEMVGLKTAVLLGLALNSGALIAGVEEKKAASLFEYGYAVGVAFQIMDDWLDAFGDEELTGKRKGGDIRQGKKTWLWIMAIEAAEEEDREFLKKVVKSKPVSEKDVTRVLELYKLYNVDELILEFSSKLLDDVSEKVSDLNLPGDKTRLLKEFGERLVNRDM